MSALRHLAILLTLAVLATAWLAPARAQAHPGHAAAAGPGAPHRASDATLTAASAAPAQPARCAGACCGIGGPCASSLAAADAHAVAVPAATPRRVRQIERVEPVGRIVEGRLRPPRSRA